MAGQGQSLPGGWVAGGSVSIRQQLVWWDMWDSGTAMCDSGTAIDGQYHVI